MKILANTRKVILQYLKTAIRQCNEEAVLILNLFICLPSHHTRGELCAGVCFSSAAFMGGTELASARPHHSMRHCIPHTPALTPPLLLKHHPMRCFALAITLLRGSLLISAFIQTVILPGKAKISSRISWKEHSTTYHLSYPPFVCLVRENAQKEDTDYGVVQDLSQQIHLFLLYRSMCMHGSVF